VTAISGVVVVLLVVALLALCIGALIGGDD
jgi:hypothetical protein